MTARRRTRALAARLRLTAGLAAGLAGALCLSACGGQAVPPGPDVAQGPDGSTSEGQVAVGSPGKLDASLLSPDLLVLGQKQLPATLVTKIRKVAGVADVEAFSMGQFYVEEQPIRYASVDPDTFRRYTPRETAYTTKLWDRVAGGEIMIRPDLGRQVPTTDDYLAVGDGEDATKIHIGALAPLSPQLDAPYLDAVVNQRWADRLGLPDDNALLVSTGNREPTRVQQQIRALLGKTASVALLGPKVDPDVAQQAVLTGTPLAAAVGRFSYTVNRNGTVNPDRAWVREYIRTEQVPILGRVTCNKAMLLQLRAALNDIVAAGLASAIHPREYGGCYVPRFIERNPARGLSFHTWGTAIDLNVPGNQRGTVGTIDRGVVRIMQRWGFNWGGLWHYTDPMHFELARIVKAE